MREFASKDQEARTPKLSKDEQQSRMRKQESQKEILFIKPMRTHELLEKGKQSERLRIWTLKIWHLNVSVNQMHVAAEE